MGFAVGYAGLEGCDVNARLSDRSFEEGGGVVCRGVEIAQFSHDLHALAEPAERLSARGFVGRLNVEKVDNDGGEEDGDSGSGKEAHEVGRVEVLRERGDCVRGATDGFA